MTSGRCDFDHLPRFETRRYVPDNADLLQAETVRGLFHGLEHRPVRSARELDAWIRDVCELQAAVDQQAAVVYIKMTCDTDHPEYAAAYQRYVEEIAPVLKQSSHDLDIRFLRLWAQFPGDASRYGVYLKGVQTDVALFREENIPLATQVELLSRDYQAIFGAMTVDFEGKEQTLPEMSRYVQEPDRVKRESAWRAMADRRVKEQARLDELFDKMVALRQQIARNAGLEQFTDYQFKAFHRFDYSPGDCKAYHQVAEDVIAPLWAKIIERRKVSLGLPGLRPWDTEVDPRHRPPLKPFADTAAFLDGTEHILRRVHPDFGRAFSTLRARALLDLTSRKGKAPGGYQQTLAESRLPFIFMNAVGVDGDVRTLLHESGHAFHALACAAEPFYPYRHAPMEFCEVASMSMELLGGDFLSEFYSPEDQARSHQKHLEDIVYILLWVAVVDAFQHWLYAHPGHSAEERRAAWVQTYNRFMGRFLDWAGLEPYQSGLWHRQLHIFEVPFYYIEYAIAQLGALQIWLKAREDRNRTLKQFQAALALGGSRPLPELFQTAGLEFDFTARTVTPLIQAIARELAY